MSTIHPATLLCVGAALACWPATRSATTRLSAAFPSPPGSTNRNRIRMRPRVVGAALAAVILPPLLPLLGLAGTVATALLFAAGWWHRRVSRRMKAEAADAGAMAEAIRMMVADLRAGAPAALAAESAAADATGQAAAVMRTLAATARLGGDIPEQVARTPDRRALAKAWSLSRRHGLPLADLFDAVRRDIQATAGFASRTNATMAGARSSAGVLAALPGLGLLLGESMGARPLHVLTGTSAGGLLAVFGSALILLGVVWTTHLTSTGPLR